MSTKKNTTNKPYEKDNFYHNTLLLLKKYRDVQWSVDSAITQAKLEFEIESGSSLEDFLDLSYAAGINLDNIKIQSQIYNIETNRKMLAIIDAAVKTMREKHKYGERYYWILYYTYLSPRQPANAEEIVAQLPGTMNEISWKTYYRWKRDAIECLSTILWGFTSRQILPIISQFLDIDDK